MRNVFFAAFLGFVGGLSGLAQAAPEDIYGIPGKTYCLKDICIGDSLAMHESKAERLPVKRLMPACQDVSLDMKTKKDADGGYYLVYFRAAPALEGSDVNTYYRVGSISYFFKENLPDASQGELVSTLEKRMGLSRDRSAALRTGRHVILKNGAEVKLSVSGINASLMAWANDSRREDINAQSGCKGKAPKL